MKTKVALRRLRRKRTEIAREPNRFDQYRDAYAEIFEEVRRVGGPDAVQALTEWTTARTVQDRRLPEPSDVRERAHEICTEQGHAVPDTSLLRTQG